MSAERDSFEMVSTASDMWQGLTKFMVLFAIFLGAALKLGVDLIRKRKMTIAQRIGVYIVTVSFGILGWLVCLHFNVTDVRQPLIITSCSYFGEHIIDWAYRNRNEIIEKSMNGLIGVINFFKSSKK